MEAICIQFMRSAPLARGGVTSAASGSVAPSAGSLISIYGINFTTFDRLVNAEAFPLPRTLEGLTVAASGLQLPLLTVSPWQINAQLPQTMPAGPTTFQVTFSDGFTALAGVTPVTRNGPAVFTYPNQQAAAFHSGTGTPADADHPASPGEILETYGVGLGPTNPAVDGGVASPSNPVAQAVQTPELLIGGQSATVVFAGLTPGLAGVYQINAMVPAAMKPGRYTVTWRTADIPVSIAGFIVVQ